MPKINAIRVVNYRYNDGKRIWLDETFDFKGGHNALITLQNGGGKTVLIQGIMQAVNPNISLRKRRWKGFFTQEGVPTYILVEWLLDDGMSYATTGVGFQMKQGRLESYMFITTYKESAPYDLRHLTLTEEADQTLRFKKLTDFKKQMTEFRQQCASRGLSTAVRTFETQTQYHQGLRELNINHEEWKVMMRKINEAEGGMNEVFENTATTERVVRELILPQVEQKLIQQSDVYDVGNPASSLFNETHTQLHGLVEEQIRLDEKIKAKDQFHRLTRLINEDLLPKKEVYHTQLEAKTQYLIETVHLEARLKELFVDLNSQQAELEQQSQQLVQDETQYEFEKKSHEYHELQTTREEKQGAFQAVEADLIQAKAELQAAIELKNQLEAAYYEYRKTQYEQKRLAKETLHHQLQAQDVDLEQELVQTGGFIRYRIEEGMSQLAQQIQALETTLATLKTEAEEIRGQQKENQSEVAKLNVSLLMTEQRLTTLKEEMETLLTSHSEWQTIDLTPSAMDELHQTLKTKEAGYQSTLETLHEQQAKTEQQWREVREKQEISQTQLTDFNHQLAMQTHEFNRFMQQKQAMLEALQGAYDRDDLTPEVVYEKEHHLTHFKQVLAGYEAEFSELKQREYYLVEELNRLSTGCHLQFPAELLEVLDDLDIVYQTGFEFLSEYDSSPVATATQSVLAHALILTPHDLDRLRRLSYDWETDFMVPVLNRDHLIEWLAETNESICSSQGLLNLVSYFNPEWLDEDYLEEQMEELRTSLSDLREQLSTLQDQRTFYSRVILELEMFHLTEQQEVELSRLLTELNQSIETLMTELPVLAKQLEDLEASRLRLESECAECEELSHQTQVAIQAVRSLKTMIETQATLHITKEETIHELNRLMAISESLSQQLDDRLNTETMTQENLRERRAKIKDLKAELLTYEGYVSAPTSQSKEFLVQLFHQLKGKRSDQELTVLEEEIKELTADIHECEEAIARLDLASEDYRQLEIQSLSYSKEQEKLIEQQRAIVEETVRQHTVLQTEIEGLTNTLEKLYRTIHETFNREPQSIEGMDLDFTPRLARLRQRRTDLKALQGQLREKESFLGQKDRELGRVLDVIPMLELELARTHYTAPSDVAGISLEDVNLPQLQRGVVQTLRALSDLQADWKKQVSRVFALFSGESLFEPLLVALRQLEHESDDYLLEGCQVFERQLVKNEAMINKLERDLSSLADLFAEFKRDCVALAQSIYEEVKLFGKGIDIQWKGTRQRLIQLKAPQPLIDLDSTMDRYVSETLEALIELYQAERLEEIDQQISSRFNVDAFLNLVTPIQSYKLYIFKIEIQHEQSAYKAWEDLVVKASGGERFFASFVLSAAILTYSRFDRTLKDISKMGKVLLMDNPFGVVTSPHLLKPVFELAKRLNIQMLCFTGISELNVYDNFDLVYALKVEGLTSQLSKIEVSVKKEPEDHIQMFHYFKQDQLF